MGQIGNWGNNIVFETSDQRILTFSDMKQKISGEWAVHKIIGQKARSEFKGPGLRSVSFTVLLDAALGVRPRTVMERLEEAVEKGTTDYLVIGGRMVGKYQWRCTSLSESWDLLYNRGELVRGKVTLTMEEYT